MNITFYAIKKTQQQLLMGTFVRSCRSWPVARQNCAILSIISLLFLGTI